jgi:hypothetical protein
LFKKGFTIEASTHRVSYNSALSTVAPGSDLSSGNMPRKSKKIAASSVTPMESVREAKYSLSHAELTLLGTCYSAYTKQPSARD